MKTKMKDEGTYNEYKRLHEISDIMGDKDSCGVVALASATGLTYKKAYDIFEQEGRKKGTGVWDHQIVNATKRSGYWPRQFYAKYLMKEYKYANTMTFNNAVKVLSKKKTYMLIGSSHVATLRNGKIVDWTQGRKLKVGWVIELQDQDCKEDKDYVARGQFFSKLKTK